VTVDGEPVVSPSDEALGFVRARVGFVFPHFNLVKCLSMLDNVRRGRPLPGKNVIVTRRALSRSRDGAGAPRVTRRPARWLRGSTSRCAVGIATRSCRSLASAASTVLLVLLAMVRLVD